MKKWKLPPICVSILLSILIITTIYGEKLKETIVLYQDLNLSNNTKLLFGTTLLSGTKIAKGTKLNQNITFRDGIVLMKGDTLKTDLIIDKEIVLSSDMYVMAGTILAKGSILPNGTELPEGTSLYSKTSDTPANNLPSCYTVLFSASKSYATSSGSILSYHWTFGDGSVGEGVTTSHTYQKPGIYQVTLLVRDNSGVSCDISSDATTIVINSIPKSVIESPQRGCVGEALLFDGTLSSDSDGKIISYLWNFGDGLTSTFPKLTYTYKKPGTYKVTLTVTDDSKSSCNINTSETTIIINDPPIANAGPDQLTCSKTINFDASLSKDNDGKIISYLWDFGDGTKGSGITTTHTYSKSGVYKVRLTVKDDSNTNCDTSVDELIVTISSPPIVNAGIDQSVCVGEVVKFDKVFAYSPDNYRIFYEWDFGDGTPISIEARPTHIYNKSGKYTVTLTITDDSKSECNKSKDTVIITVNSTPKAEAGKDIIACINQKINFDGSSSIDDDGDELQYYWTFGDYSQPQTGKIVSHSYTSTGTYIARLTVIDNSGTRCNFHTDSVKVTINIPPIANAGELKRGSVGEPIIFTGNLSKDLDGSISKYIWNFGDGSNAEEGISTSHTYSKAGTYTATLTVLDNSETSCNRSETKVTVIINQPPKANAGKDMLVCSGKVQFDGSLSQDPDGRIIDYTWDFGDGSKGKGIKPFHLYKNTGTYKVKLTIKDDSGTTTNSDSSTITVVINTPPIANAGADTIGDVNEKVIFYAGKSIDPDGDDLRYEWDFGDGSKGTGITTYHTYKDPGRYTVILTATDSKNSECSIGMDTKIVTINSPPIASAQVSNVKGSKSYIVSANQEVIFDGTRSIDNDGNIVSYFWTFGDGTVGVYGAIVRHFYAKPGRYSAILTVKDDSKSKINFGQDTVVVIVNEPPIANAGDDQIGLCSTTVTFDGSKSVDPDGKIQSYVWDFGDFTPVGSGVKPTHTYTSPGTYKVTLTVFDNSGTSTNKAFDTAIVKINQPPIAIAGKSKVVCPNEPVVFDGSASIDKDGRIIKYIWTFGDETSDTMMTEGVRVTHSYSKPGIYNATLRVIDDSGGSCNEGKDVVNIIVNAPPIAEAGPDQTVCTGTANCSAIFDGSGSSDPDGSKYSLVYKWDFGDGTFGEGIRTSHIYLRPGTYTVKLTVIDNSGKTCSSSTDTLTVIAIESPKAKIETGNGN